jgi:hypothetical protein
MKEIPVCLLCLAASVEILCAQPSAQPRAAGTLHVTAMIEGSLSIVFTADSLPEPIKAAGRGAASFTAPIFGGTFSRGSQSLAAGDTTFLISSPFSVRVDKANLLSAGYTLKAALSVPDRLHTWRIDGVDISSQGPARAVASGEPYGVETRHALVVSGTASEPRQSLTNAINFQVVAN